MAKLKRIHVNQHNIRANAKNENQALPVFTVKTYDSNYIGNDVEIHGPSKAIYRANDPLSCGARVWIESKAKVSITMMDGTILEIE